MNANTPSPKSISSPYFRCFTSSVKTGAKMVYTITNTKITGKVPAMKNLLSKNQSGQAASFDDRPLANVHDSTAPHWTTQNGDRLVSGNDHARPEHQNRQPHAGKAATGTDDQPANTCDQEPSRPPCAGTGGKAI